MSLVSAAICPGVISCAVEPPGDQVAAENLLLLRTLTSLVIVSFIRVDVPRRYDDGGVLALQDAVRNWARVGSAIGPAHVGMEGSVGEAVQQWKLQSISHLLYISWK